MVSSLGISRAGAIVPETKTQEVFQRGSSCYALPLRANVFNLNQRLPIQMQLLMKNSPCNLFKHIYFII